MFECDRKTLIMRGRWLPKGCVRYEKNRASVFRLFIVTLKGNEANERIKKSSKQGTDNRNGLETNRVPSD